MAALARRGKGAHRLRMCARMFSALHTTKYTHVKAIRTGSSRDILNLAGHTFAKRCAKYMVPAETGVVRSLPVRA